MKRIGLIALLFLSYYISTSQPTANSLIPKVDTRVELLSIVFRLANAKDFSDDINPVYTSAIQKHFDKYSNHALIKYVRHLKDSIEIAHWDVPTFAVHLSQPPSLDPLVQFNDTVPANIWGKNAELSLKLVKLIKQFYKDAKCAEFFESQKEYYNSVNQLYEKIAVKVSKPWFTTFFGIEPTEKHIAVLGLGMRNGTWLKIHFPNSYPETYTVYRMTAFDSNGMPADFTNPIYSRLLIHEYIHAFTNTLVDKNKGELRASAETILSNPEVYKLMKDTFYGNWQFLLYESMVRACAIKYLSENEGSKAAEEEMVKQEKLGFFWIRDLVNQLSNFENDKKKYPSLDLFMPQLNSFFKQVANKMKN
jgi:Domain of unknown function (DUF4932)